jgi:hypothetical protein
MNSVTLIHVTSSINEGQILENGLTPSFYSKQDVAKRIQLLLPNLNTSILLEQVLAANCGASALLRARLNDNIARLSFMSETSDKYYKNICDCVKDGGEFFTAVRKALEVVTSTQIPVPYPDAYPIICKANFPIYFDDKDCCYIDMSDQAEDISLPDQRHIEISLTVNLSRDRFSMQEV